MMYKLPTIQHSRHAVHHFMKLSTYMCICSSLLSTMLVSILILLFNTFLLVFAELKLLFELFLPATRPSIRQEAVPHRHQVEKLLACPSCNSSVNISNDS